MDAYKLQICFAPGIFTMETHQNNIEKMTAFIFHEAKEKADEIRIKAHEEYNIEKAKIVKQESEKVERSHLHRIKETEIQFKRDIGMLKARSKMDYMRKKMGIVNDVFDKAGQRLAGMKADQDLLDQALDSIENEDVIIYCNDSVKVGRDRKVKHEMRPLDKSFIGGVVIESRDGMTKCDNSFRARLKIFRGSFMDLVANRLFKRN